MIICAYQLQIKPGCARSAQLSCKMRIHIHGMALKAAQSATLLDALHHGHLTLADPLARIVEASVASHRQKPPPEQGKIVHGRCSQSACPTNADTHTHTHKHGSSQSAQRLLLGLSSPSGLPIWPCKYPESSSAPVQTGRVVRAGGFPTEHRALLGLVELQEALPIGPLPEQLNSFSFCLFLVHWKPRVSVSTFIFTTPALRASKRSELFDLHGCG